MTESFGQKGQCFGFFKVSRPSESGAGWGENLRRSDPLLYELLDEVYPRLYLEMVDWEHLAD